MQHYKSLEDLYLENAWASIGSFDGVHLGHQKLIRRLVDGAHAVGSQAVVITFFPHPASVLRGLQGPFFFTTPEERAALLEKLGVDAVITLHFDKTMAEQSAETFMRQLSAHLGLRRLLVGYNFALGKNRQGDVPALTELGKHMGYQVEICDAVQLNGETVSSSRVRALLNKGDVAGAAVLLGRNYTVTGEIVHGDGRGHGLGIPTANLSVWQERIIPAVGVYATWVYYGGQRIPSVTNIGVRPTFENEPVFARIETHLLDFNRDLYGETVELEFVRYLRREQRFPSVQSLLDQINQDIQQTREVLEHAA